MARKKKAKTAAKKTAKYLVKIGKRTVAKTRKKPRVLKVASHQTGHRKSLKKDVKWGSKKGRHALPPGKRVSKSGKVYYESRRNRSDVKRKSGWA